MGVRFKRQEQRTNVIGTGFASHWWRAVAAIALTAVLFGAGCSLESPKSPQWTVDLTIPLANRHYDVPYIIQHADREELIWDSVSGARFEVQRTLDTVFVDDNIVFPDLHRSYTDTLGTISLRPAQTLISKISLEELYNGPSGTIPGFSATIEKGFSLLSDVQRAEVRQGFVRVEVINDLALSVDSLAVIIANENPASELGRVVFTGAIDPGDSRSADVDISGKTINEQLGFAAFVRTPGGYLESPSGDSLELIIWFPDSIIVTTAVALVPVADKSLLDTIDFSTEILASAAEFSGGRVAVELGNYSNLDFDVEVLLPDLSIAGSPRSVTGFVAAHSMTQLSVELAGTSYRNTQAGCTPLRIHARLHTSGSGVPIEISAADRFVFAVNIDSPVVESVTGILPVTVQHLDNLRAEIDLPEGFEGVSLAAGEMEVEVVSSLPYPGEFALQLSGDRQQTLAIAGDILPATGEVPIASQITIADAASLLSPIPAVITAVGTVSYGDGVTSGTARADDFIVPSFRLIAPLSLYLDDAEYSGEVEGVGLPGESDDVTERFGAASILAEYDNHLPFGVVIEVRLADQRADLPANPDLVLGPTEISPAAVDDHGRTTGAVTSSDVFSVSPEQSGIFESDSLFITEIVQFFSGNGSVVTLRDSDYIDWRAMLQIATMVGDRGGENR